MHLQSICVRSCKIKQLDELIEGAQREFECVSYLCCTLNVLNETNRYHTFYHLEI